MSDVCFSSSSILGRDCLCDGSVADRRGPSPQSRFAFTFKDIIIFDKIPLGAFVFLPAGECHEISDQMRRKEGFA